MRRVSALAFVVIAAVSTTAFVVSHAAGSWKGKVAGKDDSKITGDASMAPTADGKGTEVSVMIMGDVGGSTRPWHIHMGSCAKGGGVLGGRQSYTPITVDGSGHGMSKAILAMVTPDTGSYYVNIHDSAGNMGKTVGCGDLTMSK